MVNRRRPIIAPNWNFRKPTRGEVRDIEELTMDLYGWSKGEAKEAVKSHSNYIAVLDSYTSDVPGWSGKMMIIFFGEYDLFLVGRWVNGELERVTPRR